jgi:Lon-like protease
VLLVAAAAITWIVPSNDYLFLPDKARPVAPLVTVKGGHDPKGPGGIYYDAVIVRRAKLFEQLFHFVHGGETLVPSKFVNPPGSNDKQTRVEDLREMARSQDIAAAVALKYLGYPVTIKPNGALVVEVAPGSPAQKASIHPTDVIVGVDGKPVATKDDLTRLLGRHKPGDHVRIGLRSGSGLRQVTPKMVADPQDPHHAIIGVIVEQATKFRQPVPVRIDAGQIGGPSAGLAFALDVLEELGHHVSRGYKVAATGELAPDGSVLPIGGVKQKTIGVERAGVDVFLVPAGDNAKEARKYAHRVKVIPVESFRQALRALATLPPKR